MARFAGAVFGEKVGAPDMEGMLGPWEQAQLHEEPGVQAGGVGPQLLWHITPKVWLLGDGWLGNGEELRGQLRSLGYPPAQSDAELVVQAYRHWGLGFPTHLQGSFALAFYDRMSGELILVRDSWGSRPLYWSAASDHVYFSSTLKGLLRTGRIAQTPAPEAIAAYLALGFTPQDVTPVKNIYRLLPGHLLRFRMEGGVIVQPFKPPTLGHPPAQAGTPLIAAEAMQGAQLVPNLVRFIWDLDDPIGHPGALALWSAAQQQSKEPVVASYIPRETNPVTVPKPQPRISRLFHLIRPLFPLSSWTLLQQPKLEAPSRQVMEQRLLVTDSQRRQLAPWLYPLFNPALLLLQLGREGPHQIDLDTRLFTPDLFLPMHDRAAAAAGLPWHSAQVMSAVSGNFEPLYEWPAHLSWKQIWGQSDWRRLFRLMRRHSLLVESHLIAPGILRQIAAHPSASKARLAWALLILEGWMRLFIERTPGAHPPDIPFETLLGR